MNQLKQLISGFKKGFESFGANITFIINTILLLLVYFVGVGITSLFAKITGKHFLKRGFSKSKVSYWKEVSIGKQKTEEYYKQF